MKPDQKLLVPYLWMAVLALVWGTSFLFIKIAIHGDDMSPQVLTLIRHVSGVAVLGAILVARRSQLGLPNLRRMLPLFAVMAAVASVYPWTAIAWGELHVSSALASIFNATTPIWTATLAFWLTPNERPGRLGYLGVAIAFAGTALLVAPGLVEHGLTGSVIGSLAVLSAAFGYAVAAIVQRRWLAGVDSLRAAFWQLAVGTVIMVPIAAPALPSVHLHASSLLAALALGIGGSGLAYIIFYYLLNTLGGTRTSTVTFLLPLTAVTWGLLLLHEVVTPAMLLAMAVILAGVLLTTRSRRAPTAAMTEARGSAKVSANADA